MKKIVLALMVGALTACGGGGGGTPAPTDVQGDTGTTTETPLTPAITPTTPTTPVTPNSPPTVSAGDDLVVIGGKTVKITPIITDPDGDSLRVVWEELSGTRFAQSLRVDPQGIASFFVGPVFNEAKSFDLKVTVTDTSGASAEDFIRITIKPVIQVSGAITQDATWGPQDGDIEVVGTLSVRAGATLTLLPGTVISVSHDDVDFIVEGTLYAHGEIDNPVVFTSNTRGNPVGFSWTGIEVIDGGLADLVHVVIEEAVIGLKIEDGGRSKIGGILFQYNWIAFEGPIPAAPLTSSRNTFYKNSTALGFFLTSNNEVRFSRFIENDRVFSGYFGVDPGGYVDVHDNHFINNGHVITAQGIDGGFNNGPIYLSNNWWGTTDIGQIEANITDNDDDPRLLPLTPSPASSPLDNVGAGIPAGFSLLDFSGFFGN